MRIAYVSTLTSSSWGGSEELWFQSAVEALKLNYQVGLFIYDWSDEAIKVSQLREKGADIHKRNRNPSLTTRVIGKVVAALNGTFPNFLNPYKTIRKFNPDVIVITDGSTYYTANDERLSKILLKYFPGKYIIICQSNTDYHLPTSRPHAIKLFENALRVMFVSDNNRKLAYHQLAYKLKKAELIQNPILLENFESIPFPAMNEIIHCALVGRFCISDKGQDILIAILNDPSIKNLNIEFHLYGNGDDKDYLERLIDFYNVAHKVNIEGYKENKREIWEKCHCLLMCSHTEGTPLTLLEAMIAGRVCIVTDIGGNAEWITDGYNGFLVDAPTRKLFQIKLKEALLRQNDWEMIGKAAHDSALRKIDYNPGKTLIEKIIAYN
jgi:L-malate glycosyltransferase